MILDSYIDNYIGEWNDESGNRLSIKKVDETTALVSFFAAPDGQPIYRPWCEEEPTVNMNAKYNPQEGAGLEVDLWGTRRGFTLHLSFEAQYELDQNKQDALVPGLSRYTEDDFLDQYYYLFEPLRHYIRTS
ncbi:MAG TPA: hypothetical protein VE616_08315 [Candidatus Udaeobacter sp.]|nr:hypothetical protein [Candidatus Udaeobacter sp.]